MIGVDTDAPALISDAGAPPAPGDGVIALGLPEDPSLLATRSHALFLANVIEADLRARRVLVKDDLDVRRDLGVGGDVVVGGLSAKGTLRAPLLLASLAAPSDARLKRVLGDVSPERAWERLRGLRGVRHAYREGTGLPPGERFGFVAQEVREVLPELVVEDADGTLAVDLQGMTPLLVESLRLLEARNQALRREGRAQDLALDDALARLDRLEGSACGSDAGLGAGASASASAGSGP